MPFYTAQQQKNIILVMIARDELGLCVREAVEMGLGTELRKRLSELRRDGYEFTEMQERNSTGRGYHKRWYLKSFPVRKERYVAPDYIFDCQYAII